MKLETLQKRLENRRDYFKIEIRKDANLDYPENGPVELKFYADPVNLLYPTHNISSALSSARSFSIDKGLYETFSSIQTVEAYLRQGLAKYGVELEKAIEIAECEFEELSKQDDWRIAVGIVYTAKKDFDAQGHRASNPIVVRDAAFNFAKMLNVSAQAGLSHSTFDDKIDIVGTWFTPVQMTMDEKVIPENSWIVMAQYNDDELWGKVKSGEYRGFSLGGLGRLSPVQ